MRRSRVHGRFRWTGKQAAPRSEVKVANRPFRTSRYTSRSSDGEAVFRTLLFQHSGRGRRSGGGHGAVASGSRRYPERRAGRVIRVC
jgi:hypothetical protein